MQIMNKWYFGIIIISVISLSCNLFRVSNALIYVIYSNIFLITFNFYG